MRLAVLRPEPGNAATAARAEALGATVVRLPLFEVHPLAWIAPDPAQFDALLLTSANAVRHGGLQAMRRLPVLAVGAATAKAARAAGFAVARTGSGDAAALLDDSPDFSRILHLAGRDRAASGGRVTTAISVYASDPVAIAAEAIAALAGSIAVLHSARAAARFAELVDHAGLARDTLCLAAISAVVAQAAGSGWRAVTVAPVPSDAALLAAAFRLGD
jgi:uroporphyrinogen-III synthase